MIVLKSKCKYSFLIVIERLFLSNNRLKNKTDMSGARNYKPSHLKKLFALSGNKCSMTNCARPLISIDGAAVLGKICHISAASENGPRWDKDMDDDQRRDFSNLILMCGEHHDEIDADENLDKYKTRVLSKMKEEHEMGNVSLPFEFKQTHIDQIEDQLDKIYDISVRTYEKVDGVDLVVNRMSKQLDYLTKIIEEKGGVDLSQSLLDELVNEEVSKEQGWAEEERHLILEKLLAEYNDKLKTKKDLLKWTHMMILSFFKASELKEKIDEWLKHGDNPIDINQLEFISTAVMAYEFLERIPRELIDDFKRLNYCPIHHTYFDGYLGQFIREVKLMKSLGKDLEKTYKGDRYFYENLARIIRSLKGFLDMNPKEYYQKREKAVITASLPDSFLIVSTSSWITLRSTDDLAKTYSRLPLDKQFSVSDLKVVRVKNKTIIVGFNAIECFYWNPEEDFVAHVFYESGPEEQISNLFIKISEDKRINCTVQVKDKMINFIDFEKVESRRLDATRFLIPLRIGYVAMKRSFGTVKGDFLFYVDDELKSHTILSTEQLSEEIRKNEEIKEWIDTCKAKYDPDIADMFCSLESFQINKIENSSRDLILIKANIDKRGILVIVEVIGQNIAFLKMHLLNESTTVSIDCFQLNDDLIIGAGLLDLNRSEAICELIQFNESKLISREIIMKERPEMGIRDMFYTQISEDGNLMFSCQEGNVIIRYDRQEKVFTEIENVNEYVNGITYVSKSRVYD